MAATFRPDQCHHRNAGGAPDCRKHKGRPYWLYCQDHEAEYREKRGMTPLKTAPPKTTRRGRPPANKEAPKPTGATRARRADRIVGNGKIANGTKRTRRTQKVQT